MKNKRLLIGICLLVVLVGLGVWAAMFLPKSPAFRDVEQLQSQLLDEDSALTDAERAEGWSQVKQQWSSLSPSEQRQLKRPHEERAAAKVDQYMQLSTAEERTAFLDAELAVWDAKLAKGKSAKPGSGDSGKKANASGKRGEKGGAGGKSSDTTKVWDEEAIREKTRSYLDATTPEKRAYDAALKERWFETHESGK